MANRYQSFMDSKIGAETAKAFGAGVDKFYSNVDKITSGTSSRLKTAGSRYMSVGKGIGGAAGAVGWAYDKTFGAFGRVVSSFGDSMQYEARTAWNMSDLQGGPRRAAGGLSRATGKLTRGVGNLIQRPGAPIAAGGRLAARAGKATPGKLLGGAKAFRRGIKSIPKPIRKFGTIGGIALGLTAMLGVSVLKGAMNQGKQIAYDRYMEDAAQSKNVLATTRLGNASGTNRMLGYGGTVGLSNSLSRTRHGR